MSVLNLSDLHVSFSDPKNPGTKIPIVKGIDLTIEPGEIVGLVGESGSGKSVTALSVMGLLDPRTAHIEGSVRLRGDELVKDGGADRALRGSRLSMVFQEPMTALDVLTRIVVDVGEASGVELELSSSAARTHGGFSCPTLTPG